MNVHPLVAALSAIAICSGIPSATVAAETSAAALEHPPENLKLVSDSQLQRLYLAPGADLSHITGVILEPTEVVFRDGWVRDFNRTVRGSSGRLTDTRAEAIRNEASTGMGDVFASAFRNGGFQLVQAPGPGVVRVHPYIANLSITAPVERPGRTTTWARDSGEATLVVDVLDSRSHALLARALDRRIVSSSSVALQNSVSNRSEFRTMFETWARSTVEDLNALKTASATKH
jgi:hypothetical protein